MDKFRGLFKTLSSNRPAVIGMMHVLSLPGTPGHTQTIDVIVEKACKEAILYDQYELDGVIIENMHDRPYLNGTVGPEIVSSMTRICTEVKKVVRESMSVGIQVLSAANKESLSVAHSSGAGFIRAEGFVFSHIGDEGWMDSCAGDLLRYRKLIGADDVLIWTDVKKKHSSHFVTSDVSLCDMVQAAEFFKSDGIVLTGSVTGDPVSISDVYAAVESTRLPVIIGSGITTDNVNEYKVANGLIVGSYLKEDGCWFNDIDEKHVSLLMENISK